EAKIGAVYISTPGNFTHFAQSLPDLRHRSLNHTVAIHGYIRIVIFSYGLHKALKNISYFG
ncbi:MAG: hypothetical protein WB610_08050, partial [Rhodomicrobium sp.]